MSNDTRLTVYELGIIKNFLRDKLISIKIKEFSVDYLTENKEKTNEQERTSRLELTAISDKVEVMISKSIAWE